MVEIAFWRLFCMLLIKAQRRHRIVCNVQDASTSDSFDFSKFCPWADTNSIAFTGGWIVKHGTATIIRVLYHNAADSVLFYRSVDVDVACCLSLLFVSLDADGFCAFHFYLCLLTPMYFVLFIFYLPLDTDVFYAFHFYLCLLTLMYFRVFPF